MYLSKAVKVDYPKLIVDTMCEQLSNFNTLTSFKYQTFYFEFILKLDNCSHMLFNFRSSDNSFLIDALKYIN